MTELENKLVEKILEKMDLDQLIDRIGLDVLTDRIAEKAAEMIVEKEYPSAPAGPVLPGVPVNPVTPVTPTSPWTTPGFPPITVMYGVTTTEFNPHAATGDASTSSSATYQDDDRS